VIYGVRNEILQKHETRQLHLDPKNEKKITLKVFAMVFVISSLQNV